MEAGREEAHMEMHVRLGDRVGGPRTGSEILGGDDLGQLASRLRVMITELSAHQPDPSDGSGWLDIDAALTGLHAALVALEEFDRAH
jgi:hypothetical protein